MYIATLASFYTDHARLINMILLILVIAGFTANMILRRDKTIRRTRRIAGWLFALLCNFVYGYSFSIREHRPFNPSVLVGTIIMFGTVIAIAWHPPGDNNPPPHDGALPNRFMFWLDERVRAFKSRHRKENHESDA